MINWGNVRPASLALAVVVAGATCWSSGAWANLGSAPRIETTCLKSRVAMKPEKGAKLADAAPGVRVALVRVRICTASQQTCTAHGLEVPMSRCAAAD